MADSLKDIDLSPAPMAEERDLDADLSTDFAPTDLSATDLSTNELSTNDLADSFDAELDGDLELPDEFDLSSAGEELPDIERTDFDFDSSFGELELPDEAPAQQADTFAASTFESTLEASTFDAPASFEAPAPAPVEAPAAFETTAPESAPTLDSSDDFDFLADTDEIATKLDLARAYIDMGDTDGARDILDEVLQEGTDTQKQDASNLLSRIG
jgi:pilus assembly protein FimV